jgi:hypothetical protein
VTTPGNWSLWHPSSLGVSGAVDHSLEVGEQVTEDFRVAGHTGRAVWTARERQAPTHWVIEATSERGRATITYRLTPLEGGTYFERELVYYLNRWLFALVDLLLRRRRVRRESEEALRRLKEVLEKERD